jgi:hypothetical protein
VATKSAQWDQARLLCPPEQYGAPEWREHYRAHPEILTQMLGDLYRVYKSEQAKRNGSANPQGGRRKSHINGSLDELWSIITPRYAHVPFAQAVRDLEPLGRGGRGQQGGLRSLALRSNLTERTLRRMLNGQVTLERDLIEAVARGLRVHPAYFLEWRVLIVQELVAEVLFGAPHLSIGALRNLRPPA